jgi:predicted DNA-binding antitoxin AbrB/MazE fold protein
METTVYSVKLKDGREFRIFCRTKNQKKRFLDSYIKIKHLVSDFTEITNGIHIIKEWEQIVETL